MLNVSTIKNLRNINIFSSALYFLRRLYMRGWRVYSRVKQYRQNKKKIEKHVLQGLNQSFPFSVRPKETASHRDLFALDRKIDVAGLQNLRKCISFLAREGHQSKTYIWTRLCVNSIQYLNAASQSFGNLLSFLVNSPTSKRLNKSLFSTDTFMRFLLLLDWR